MPIIFCPQCSELILEQATCATCGWLRTHTSSDAGVEAWRAAFGRRLNKSGCSPIIAAGHYCLCTEDGILMALDLQSGQLAWQRPLGENCTAYALAGNGMFLFVGIIDLHPIPVPGKAFLAIDARTGHDIWRSPTEAHSLSAGAVAGDTVYFTTSDDTLHAVDSATGHQRWVVAHPAWGPAAPVVGEGVVCAGGRGADLVGYAVADGAELWRFSSEGWFDNQLYIANRHVYAPGWDGYLYVLAADTGQLLWNFKGERGKGLTTPPIITGDRLFVGSRVYRPTDSEPVAAYALLALQAQDGVELWRFYTERPISAPPTVADDTLLFGSDDGCVYALDVASGTERWRMQINRRIVTQPQVDNDLVYFGERDGVVHAVRWRTTPVEIMLHPSTYILQRAYDKAALAHALLGEYDQAAVIYEKNLGQHANAARLYEQAGQPQKAAPLWEQVGNLRRARDCYRQAGDTTNLARLFEQMGEPLQAAQLFEETGNLEAAASLYEQFGDRMCAADIYHHLGHVIQARSIWASLGHWERLVDTLVIDGQLTEAARMLEQQSQLERAADLYEKAGELQQAVRIRAQLEQWERVVDLASRTGDYEQVATAHDRLGHSLYAARAYEQAAEQCIDTAVVDHERTATLYEKAERLYRTVFDVEHADACYRQVRRYRKLPDIVVGGNKHEVFVEYEWNTLTLQLENSGYGLACNINIDVHGTFDLDGDRRIWSLPPDQTLSRNLFVRPQRGQYGPTVPLKIVVTYEDVHGVHYNVTQHISIQVVQQRASSEITTPHGIYLPIDQLSLVATPPEQVPLILHIAPHGDVAQIIWEADVLGRRTSTFRSPYDRATLPLVIKALDAAQWPDHPSEGPRFSQTEQDQLTDHGLWAVNRVVTDIHQRVGRALYESLVADLEGATALRTIRDHATAQGLSLSFLLRFPPDAVDLAMLPWELLWDERSALLLSRSKLASCVRYLDLDQALPPPRAPGTKLRLLAITPNAGIDEDVRAQERAVRTTAWAELIHAEMLTMEELNPATPAGLVDRIQAGPPIDIVHFYGHGRYRNGQGELLFDAPDGTTLLNANQLAALLGDVRLIVIHACQSSMVSDAGLLTGVASALSAAGVPAVVAMQVSCRIEAATRFAGIIYRALARSDSIQRAVGQARQALYVEESDSASWYVPTLLIRARDTGPLRLITPR